MGNNLCNNNLSGILSNGNGSVINQDEVWREIFLAEMKKLNIEINTVQKWINGSSKPSTKEEQELFQMLIMIQQQIQSQSQSNPQNNQFMFGTNTNSVNSHQNHKKIKSEPLNTTNNSISSYIKTEPSSYHGNTVISNTNINNISFDINNIDVVNLKQEINKIAPFLKNTNNNNNGNMNNRNDVNLSSLQDIPNLPIPRLEREASDATSATDATVATTISTHSQSPNYLNLNVMNGMISPNSPNTPSPMYNINGYSSSSIQAPDTRMKDLSLPKRSNSNRSHPKNPQIDISKLPQIPLNDPELSSIYKVPPLVPPPPPTKSDDNDINMKLLQNATSVSYFDISMKNQSNCAPSKSITGRVNNAHQPPSATSSSSIGLAPNLAANKLTTQQYQHYNILNGPSYSYFAASNPLDFSQMPVIDIFDNKANSEQPMIPQIKPEPDLPSLGVKSYNKSAQLKDKKRERNFKNCRKQKNKNTKKRKIDIEAIKPPKNKPKLVQARAGCDKIFKAPRAKTKQNKRSRSSTNNILSNKYPLGGGGIMKGNKLKELKEKQRKNGIEIIDEVFKDGPIQFVKCNETEALCDKFYFCVVTITRKVRRGSLTQIHIETERKYKCLTDNCDHGHLYAQKCHFVRHARTDHAKLRFECEHCGKQFRQSTQKNEHLKAKHGQKVNKWQCPYGCNQHFAQLRGVWRHVNADRKCDARPRYFCQREVNLLKKHWNNPTMSQLLKFSTNSDIPKESAVTIEMQQSIRQTIKAMIQEFSLKDERNDSE